MRTRPFPPRGGAQPTTIFALAGAAILLLLLIAINATRPSPPPTPVRPNTSQANTNQASPQLSPLSATTISIASAGSAAPLSFTLNPSLDRWTLSRGPSTTLAQTPAVRGALTLLRDALAQPALAQSPSQSSPTSTTRITLRTDTLSRTLLLDTQALGGVTRVTDELARTTHPGSADLATLFSPRSLLAWADASALPELAPSARELAISLPGFELHVVRSATTQRWAMQRPVLAPIETSALDQLLSVLRALQLQSPQPLSPELASQHSLDAGRHTATITLTSSLRGSTSTTPTSTTPLVQRVLVGNPADAGAKARWVATTADAPGLLTLSPTLGTLDVQAILDFARSPEALVARAAIRAAPGDIASLALADDADAITALGTIAPHEPNPQQPRPQQPSPQQPASSSTILHLVRASPEHRAALALPRDALSWVLPAPEADARVRPASTDQAALAQALTELLTSPAPSSMLLLTSSTTLSSVFTFSQAQSSGPQQSARAVATFTARDLAGEALETGALALTTSGEPRVLLRVGRVLRVFDASLPAARTLHTLLPRELGPEG